MQVMTGMDVRSRRAERRCYGRASKSGRLSSPAGSRATTTAGGNGSAASGATRSASRASALARTPSRRSRRVRSTRFRQLAGGAADLARIERVRGEREVARRDPEVVEAELDADRLRRVRLAREVAGELLAQLGEDRAEDGRSRTACRSRSKVVSRLIDFGSLEVTTARSSRPCEASCSQAPKLLPKRWRRNAGSAAAISPIVSMPSAASRAAAFGPMPLTLRAASGQMRAGDVGVRRAASGRRACRARRRSSRAACSA